MTFPSQRLCRINQNEAYVAPFASSRFRRIARRVVFMWITVASFSQGCSRTADSPNPSQPAASNDESVIRRPSEEEVRRQLRALDERLAAEPGDAQGYFERGKMRAELRRFLSAEDRSHNRMACYEDYMFAHDVAGGDWLTDPKTGRVLTPQEAAKLPANDEGHIIGFEGVRRDHGVLISRDENGEAYRVGGPGHVLALVAAGRVAMSFYQVQVCADLVERAAAIDPKNPNVLAEQARLKGFMLGNWGVAITELKALSAEAKGKDRIDFLFNLALCYGYSGSLTQAEETYHDILASDPLNNGALTNLGQILIDQGRVDEGIEVITDAVAKDPQQVFALINMSAALIQQEKWEESLRFANQALQAAPSIPAAWNNKSAALSELGRWDEAIAASEQSIRLLPEHPDGHYNLGTIHLERGDLLAAIEAFRRGLKADPSEAKILFNLGLAYAQTEDFQAAERTFRRGGRIDPEDARIWNSLGIVMMEQARYDESREFLERAISLNSNNAAAVNNFGNLYLKINQLDDARRKLRQALRMNPKSPNALWNLCNSYLIEGKPAEAIATAETAMSALPAESHPHSIRAYTHAYQGEFDAAIEELDKAVELDAENSDTYFHRAIVRWQQGRDDDAVSDLQRCLEFDPTEFSASIYLSIIEEQRGNSDAAKTARSSALESTYEHSWSRSVLRFLDGAINENDLLAVAVEDQDKCEAYYFAGEQLRLTDASKARKKFTRCVDLNQAQCSEHRLARWRLSRK